MELNREQVKKELALFIDDNPVELHFHHSKTSKFLSFLKLVLDVITTDEQKIYELENRLKECENGYEGTLYLERCKLHDAEQKVKELTEKNEAQAETITNLIETIKSIYADIARKIQERATTFFNNDDMLKYIEVDAKYINEQIDRIVKEVLEGEE